MSVLVYTENWDGKFKKLSFEICSYASAIAEKTSASVTAVTFGSVSSEEAASLGNYGVSKLICAGDASLAGDPRTASTALAALAEKEQANIVIFAGNNQSRALAPRLSVRMKAALVTGVVALPASMNPLIVRKKVFTSKAFADVKVNAAACILTLSQNSFGLVEKKSDVITETYSPEPATSGIQVIQTQRETGKILLSDAEVVVSGGRGMKGPENWTMIEELAQLLGAATACSRPVSDEGWRPHSEHVGQTGKIIAPNLYIACGISGAIQHLGGISSSKVIVAINKDKDAPIFEAAHYGILGDVQTVIPELTKAFKEQKG